VGGWSTSRPGRFTPGRETRYSLYRRLGRPQGRSGWLRKISPPPGFDPRTVQPVASRYTDWAIAAHYATDINFTVTLLTFIRYLKCSKLLSCTPCLIIVSELLAKETKLSYVRPLWFEKSGVTWLLRHSVHYLWPALNRSCTKIFWNSVYLTYVSCLCFTVAVFAYLQSNSHCAWPQVSVRRTVIQPQI
jgi:hypothetical protein